MRKLPMLVVLVLAVSLPACTSAPPEGSAFRAKAPASQGPSATQIADLGNVDTSVKPTGSSVSELITIDDVRKIIGRDDIVFANES